MIIIINFIVDGPCVCVFVSTVCAYIFGSCVVCSSFCQLLREVLNSLIFLTPFFPCFYFLLLSTLRCLWRPVVYKLLSKPQKGDIYRDIYCRKMAYKIHMYIIDKGH